MVLLGTHWLEAWGKNGELGEHHWGTCKEHIIKEHGGETKVTKMSRKSQHVRVWLRKMVFLLAYIMVNVLRLVTNAAKTVHLLQKSTINVMIWVLIPVFDWPINHNDSSRWFAISSPHLFAAIPVSVLWVGLQKSK